ncbi:MAG: bifunctional riboflavin kinase/FAD synthetase [Rhodocyclaceae bacterium]|nr:bifunctional riboflavin kinase/FAD synthetase [Rhodocyclaceae bacterium]
MLLHRTIPSVAHSSRVLAIGNFDGVHLGHQSLLARLAAKARELTLPAAVMTFEPHPRELINPEAAPARLTSLREKLGLFDACGVDEVFLLHFSRRLASLSAEAFIERVLVKGLAVRYLIVGDDFRFGQGRRGDFAMLVEAGRRYGFAVESMSTIEIDGERVSSSAVREALAAGDLAHAARLLGRPYGISGRVIHGEKLGRRLGWPTANIQLKRKRLALSGVFAVTVSGLDKRHLPGAASLGVRPTLGEGLAPILEVHLFDFDRDIYGAHVTVHFLHKLRDEMKFASLEALAVQIARDIDAVRHYFSQAQMHHG